MGQTNRRPLDSTARQLKILPVDLGLLHRPPQFHPLVDPFRIALKSVAQAGASHLIRRSKSQQYSLPASEEISLELRDLPVSLSTNPFSNCFQPILERLGQLGHQTMQPRKSRSRIPVRCEAPVCCLFALPTQGKTWV